MSGPAKILGVDDEADFEQLIRQRFRRQIRANEFEFHFAHHGEEALAVLAQEPDIELLLLDINMPVMDGLTFVQRVRTRPEWRSMTLMMVTTEAEYDQIVRALAAGAHEYLIKPFTPEAFADKLQLLGVLPERTAS